MLLKLPPKVGKTQNLGCCHTGLLQVHNDSRFSHYLIHNPSGEPIQQSAFTSAWRRVMDNALKNGLTERFTFHDIKAKGVSDHESKHSGHKSERMKHTYDRKISQVISTK